MQQGKNRRPHRTPPDPEELARRLARREQLRIYKLQIFKSSLTFKVFNLLNVCCFFIYWELIFCFWGICHFKEIVPERMETKYRAKTDSRGFKYIREINLLWYQGKNDKIIVEDFVPVHDSQKLRIRTGKDFILQKDLKVKLGDGNKTYRLHHASPLMFLCILLILVNSVVYGFNMNELPVVLQGSSLMNLLVIVAICFI